MTDPPLLSALQLVGLWIYPIKSCAGIQVISARVTPDAGLDGDREWIIINSENQQVWMGEIHQMALIQPGFDGDDLVLRSPGCSDLRVSRQISQNPCEVNIWNDIEKVNETFSGFDAGEHASRWLTSTLGRPLRLVRLGKEGQTRKALMPLHVVSLASLRALNQRLSEEGHPPVELERFRPNLVIDHEELAPFVEEQVSRLRWENGLELEMIGACIRCIMPNVSPKDATAGREPLAAVTRLSRERAQKNPIFGVYGKAQAEGVLTVGQFGTAF
ncbi:MOSC domain-containing protein [Deinococcus cellulosilyticus]|uniref:Molybdenum cofactor sulfurase n=1 Tax=Deinococcus cellulosilyticus (strain DSM 18568 / NBRC 106333 / KACC 11606 / 5516J-15) TaxID=1223518 RepID=A0A511N5M9_DEIC1|nr:MOSC N-terminal beta barrel domain-containing protein [Deinococcus cellulosilyticus]GEM48153.1 molybdenum cofactor sulfurase [Deinococcus cellulosilyticus NBRC 106333 = KACC 11606]